MQFYKCDKCGKELTLTNRKVLFIQTESSNKKSDLEHDIDLCVDCEKEVMDYLELLAFGTINKKGSK